jgi:hypothetical protein
VRECGYSQPRLPHREIEKNGECLRGNFYGGEDNCSHCLIKAIEARAINGERAKKVDEARRNTHSGDEEERLKAQMTSSNKNLQG